MDRVVIVGAGLAGLRAAERLREQRGFRGSVTIIGDERHGPYNRTPLSKQVLTGSMRPSDLGLEPLVALDAVWRTGAAAGGLDPRRRVVHLAGAEPVPYDGLVIATGVDARVLRGAPTRHDRVHMLRTVDDAVGLLDALVRVRRVAIVGGGFIGCEVASSLRARAIRVSLVDLAPTLLHHVLGPVVGSAVTEINRDAGVDLHLGTSVAWWEDAPNGVRIRLVDGTSVRADLALVCIGTVPRVDWLHGLGLDLRDGVLCGATGHVHGLDDVVACGDVARWPNDRFDHVPRRVEHWIDAVEQARHAADTLLDGPRSAPRRGIPRFWSEQHGVRIQAIGMPALGPDVEIVHHATPDRRFVATYRRDGRLMGAVGLDEPTEMIRYASLIEAQALAPPRPLVGAPDPADRVA